MYFKTSKDSKTGKTLSVLMLRRESALSARSQYLKNFSPEIKSFRQHPSVAWGGLNTIVIENENVDLKRFKIIRKHPGNLIELSPRLTTKSGDLLQSEWSSLPEVTNLQLNNAVGYTEFFFNYIGFDSSNLDYFVFSVGDGWKYIPPEDCIEITYSEAIKLCPKLEKIQ